MRPNNNRTLKKQQICVVKLIKTNYNMRQQYDGYGINL